MAIAPLRKVTLIGRAVQKDDIVQGMQRLACMHVIDLAGENKPPPWEHPTHSDLFAALKYLQQCPTQRPPSTQSSEYNAKRITEEVLANRNRRRTLQEEKETLVDAIDQVQPWGEFVMPAEETLGGQAIWFYRIRHRNLADVPADVVREIISADREFNYLVVIAPKPPEGMPAPPLKLDERPLSQLREELSAVEKKLEATEVERIALTRWTDALRRDLHEAEREIERVNTAEQLFRDDPVVAMQGWVPKTSISGLESFAKENSLALVVREPGPDEQPPTLLKNPAPINGAEDTVTFFMTPRYGTWDPSLVMYLSFSLFFAMIMADAGYGLLLAAGLIALAGRLGKTKSGRRFRNLATFMVAVTIIYGVMIGSYFGIAPPEGSFLDRFVIKSEGVSIVNNRDAMMLLSASIGVFHLALANVIVAGQKLGSSQALSNVGWVAFLFGGWMMVLAEVPKPPVAEWLSGWFGGAASGWSAGLWSNGQWLLIGGLAMVWAFSSARPLFSGKPVDWLMRPVDGVMGLTNVTKAFGDALSYLRLFALGLASGQLAMIFNQLASDVSEVRGIGLFLGLLIFVVGHSLNLVLAIVGGVVHGLRLNCIEFFSWSLNEEGRPFQAFGEKAGN
jgi:V/A-type H+-transporting ATPase subunit I